LESPLFFGDIASAFFIGTMEEWNRGMLGQKPGKDSMFIKGGSQAVEPIIPIFQRSMIPIVSGAN
jgi:hypothetical protein